MKLLLIDNTNSQDIINVCLPLKYENDLLVHTNFNLSEYHINTTTTELVRVIKVFNPDMVLVYGQNISFIIERLILLKPSKFFIISILKEQQYNLDFIIKHSIKVVTYDEKTYQSIKEKPSKDIILIQNEEETFKNLLNNLLKNKPVFEAVVRPTKYGLMGYVKNDLWFIMDLVNRGAIYEANLIEDHLTNIIKNSKYIFDIGAHCGSHTIVYSSMNPDAIIQCFEPQSVMYHTLLLNIRNNNRNRVNAHNMALGREVGILRLSNSIADGPNEFQPIDFTSNNFYNLGGMQIGTDGEEVLCDVLDNYDYGGCDFIKIDVEGFESLVFAGGQNLIKKYRPSILFEHNNKTVKEEVKEKLGLSDVDLDVFAMLRSLGYTEFIKVNNDNYLTR
jgi:FkbM family methyltransferase